VSVVVLINENRSKMTSIVAFAATSSSQSFTFSRRSQSGSFSSTSSYSSHRRRHERLSVDEETKKKRFIPKANIDDYDIVPKSVVKSSSGKGGFVGGVLLGGAVFGALGFLFAPQLSKHILKGKKVLDDLLEEDEEEEEELEDEDGNAIPTTTSSSSSMRLEKRAEKELEETRKSLNQKIAELNKAIDEFSEEADVRLNAKLGRLSEELDEAAEGSF
jgi:gas vesicle protein